MATNWILVSLDENFDPREDDTGILQQRSHFVMVRYRMWHITTDAAMDSDTGEDIAQTALQAYTGAQYIFGGSTFGLSTRKFVCTSDKKTLEAVGTDIVRQTQTWEMYSPYTDADAAWGWNT